LTQLGPEITVGWGGACAHAPAPAQVTTDLAPAYPKVVDKLLAAARPATGQCANNPIEADHGRFKARGGRGQRTSFARR
jgi:transposase-like protein